MKNIENEVIDYISNYKLREVPKKEIIENLGSKYSQK